MVSLVIYNTYTISYMPLGLPQNLTPLLVVNIMPPGFIEHLLLKLVPYLVVKLTGKM